MSDEPPRAPRASDFGAGQINIQVELARIDRDRAEAQKFAAEQRKLIAEAETLASAQARNYATAFNQDRSYQLAYWKLGLMVASPAIAAAIAAVATVLAVMWRHP